MANTERFIKVEAEVFSRGMQKLFEGMSEVFSSLGMEETLLTEERKWRPSEDGKGEAGKTAETDKAADTADVGATADEPIQKKGRKKAKGAESTDSSEPTAPAEPDVASMDDDPPFDTDSEPVAETKVETQADTKESAVASAVAPAENPTKKQDAETSITVDDITKIIVQKIKQNRSNNQRIGQLLKAYGVNLVSDLPADKYEAFLTDIAAL